MINSRYIQQNNEDSLEYLLRLVEIKMEEKPDDLEWQDIVEYCNLNCHYDSLRKAMQPDGYGAYYIYKKFKNKLANKVITDDELLNHYKLQKQEIEKEKIKVRTEKFNLRQALREEARFELFIEHAIDAIEKNCKLNINRVPAKNNYNSNIKKSGLLLFADPHYGKELKINGLHGEVLNEYNIDIFEKRMWKLFDETVEIIKREKFDRINIFNLGDELEGMLRVSQLMALKKGLIDSTIDFTYFIANWLNELSKYVSIDYYSTQGNHTDLRLISGKKGDFPHENLSKIIQALTGEILRDNPNVIVHKNNTDKIFTNIQGFNVLGIHGEEKNVVKAIRDFSFIYNTQIDCLCTGHRHHINTINTGISKWCVGVGGIIGIDDYSMKLKKTSNPTASFVVFKEDVGKTLEYTIYLD